MSLGDDSFDLELWLETLRRRIPDPAHRAALAAKLKPRRRRGHQPGVPNSTRTFDSPTACVRELFAWADGLPLVDLPPQEKHAARVFGRMPKTIGRWVREAGFDDWEAFVQAWLAYRHDRFGPAKGTL